MRINKFVAATTGLSRRAADKVITQGRVTINQQPATIGSIVADGDRVTLDGQLQQLQSQSTTIMLNKPVGYVCSRRGQGSKTIYELLPEHYRSLKPVGRLDKNSSGLLLLTNNGQLAHELTHPRYAKRKIYEITLNKSLTSEDQITIEHGIQLEDGSSRLALQLMESDHRDWRITMSEGRNRQIRRTFAALHYRVITLHRTQFGDYELGDLTYGAWSPSVTETAR